LAKFWQNQPDGFGKILGKKGRAEGATMVELRTRKTTKFSWWFFF